MKAYIVYVECLKNNYNVVDWTFYDAIIIDIIGLLTLQSETIGKNIEGSLRDGVDFTIG